MQSSRIDLRRALHRLDNDAMKSLLCEEVPLGGGERNVVNFEGSSKEKKQSAGQLIKNIFRLVSVSTDAIELQRNEGAVWTGIAGDLDRAKADLLEKYYIPAGPRIVLHDTKRGTRTALYTDTRDSAGGSLMSSTLRCTITRPCSAYDGESGSIALHAAPATPTAPHLPTVAVMALDNMRAGLRALERAAASPEALSADAASCDSTAGSLTSILADMVRLPSALSTVTAPSSHQSARHLCPVRPGERHRKKLYFCNSAAKAEP